MFFIVWVRVLEVRSRGLHAEVVILVPRGHHKSLKFREFVTAVENPVTSCGSVPHKVGDDHSLVDQFLLDHKCLRQGIDAELGWVGVVGLLVGVLVDLSFHKVEIEVQFRFEAVEEFTFMLF